MTRDMDHDGPSEADASGARGRGRDALSRLSEFIRLESSAGLLLMAAAALAIVLANLPFGDLYVAFQQIPGSVTVGGLSISKPLLLWVNDLWMAVFFFLVGLEIKREFLEGELSTRADIVLPAAGAVGGMAVRRWIYVP